MHFFCYFQSLKYTSVASSVVLVDKRVIEGWVNSYTDERYYQWAIVLKDKGESVGSIGVVRGMKYEGTLRSSDRNNQGICDVCYYGILKFRR